MAAHNQSKKSLRFGMDTLMQSVAPVVSRDWHVLAASQDLPSGSLRAVCLLGQDLVLWRGLDGALHLWRDRCPHRSVRLSRGRVVDKTLVCAYHGMVYGPEGQCVQVPTHPGYIPPSHACVPTYRVQERYGLIFACLGTPVGDLPTFPEWEEPGFVTGLSGPHMCQTGGYRAIENFLDITHFPFVHPEILGDPARPAIADYKVVVDAQGVHIPNLRVWQPDPLGIGKGDYVNYSYHISRPLTGYLRKVSPGGECLALLYCVTPVTEEMCVGWMLMAMNFIGASGLPAAIAFQDRVIQQDITNLETHLLKQLPLGRQVEFHVPGDRASLAYRQWLQQLGVTYGILGA